MMDRYTKLAKDILTIMTYALAVTRIVSDHWEANFAILSNQFSDNGAESISRFLVAVFRTLGVNNLNTTNYHS